MRRRLDPEERRSEILAVAARAFSSSPYDEVHVDAIAREANASRALVNHYFGDKRGLFLAVARSVVDRVPAAVRDDLTGGDPAAMVDANTAAWLDSVEAAKQTFLAFAGAGPIGRDAELEALQDEFRDRVATRMLANHLGTTDFPPAALIAMRATLGLIERAVVDWVTGRGGTRAQTHTLIATAILTTVKEILPAVEAAAGDLSASGGDDGAAP